MSCSSPCQALVGVVVKVPQYIEKNDVCWSHFDAEALAIIGLIRNTADGVAFTCNFAGGKSELLFIQCFIYITTFLISNYHWQIKLK